jgi:hypothetical protein
MAKYKSEIVDHEGELVQGRLTKGFDVTQVF